MALLTGGPIPQAAVANQLAAKEASGNESLTKTVADAINAAVHLGNFTASVSVSGISAAFIQEMTNLLQQLGYGYSISSTTLTITW